MAEAEEMKRAKIGKPEREGAEAMKAEQEKIQQVSDRAVQTFNNSTTQGPVGTNAAFQASNRFRT